MIGRSGVNGLGQWTILLLIISFFPTYVIASWSTSGESFDGELVVGGLVTDTRPPWSWKVAGATNKMDLPPPLQNSKQSTRIWQGLMNDEALLLGKTSANVINGRDGLAPSVTFGNGVDGFSLIWRGQGEAEVQLPVYDSDDPNQSIGQLSFRLISAAMTKHIRDKRPTYVSMYNDSVGNGLPPKEMAVQTGVTGEVLCGIFAGEGPEWLCENGLNISESKPLSWLTDTNVIRPEIVYGIRTISGSGVLKIIDGASLPSRWKATIPVKIEYR